MNAEGDSQPAGTENTAEPVGETEDGIDAQILEKAQEPTYSLRYRAHVQNKGWMSEKTEGQIGTTGQSLRMEAFTIRVVEQTADGKEKKLSGAVEYRAHVQNIGWQNWVSDGGTAGTTGQKKQIEAVQIRLTGSLQGKYDIYYRAHCADYGDLGWAKNGETAGTTGFEKSLQALTIVLVKKGSANAPVQSARSYYEPTDKGRVTYQSHVQDIGWQTSVADGAKSGTTGQSKRMEALRIYLTNPKDANGKEITGSVEYRAHVQDIGWQNWVSEGKTAGTTGQSKRLEAVQIRLTGELAKQYDVYYRVHSANIGDLGWAKNGETAGSIEYRKAVESVYIKVVKKGSQDAPTQSGRTYLDAANIGKLSNTVSVSGKGWQSAVGNKQTAGTTGQSRQIEALKLSIDTSAANAYSGGIQYKAHIQDTGWSGMASNGNVVGNSGSGKRIEAVQISLTGELAKYCDVYYRAHVQNYGWLGWAMNGQSAGTTDCSYRMEALQVTVVPKWSEAPGSMSGAFKNTPYFTPVQIRDQINSAGGSRNIISLGGYNMSSGVANQLQNAVNIIRNKGRDVGFLMIDMKTGKGIAYNADKEFYSASTVKGPYVASVVSAYPDSIWNWAGTMQSSIAVSSNSGYATLRNSFGSAPMLAWCSQSGVRNNIAEKMYPYYSAKELAKLWTKNYEYFEYGQHGATIRSWYRSPLNSMIYQNLGTKYTTYSKPGWIGSGNYNATNDAGIVYAGNRPYILAVMTDCPAQFSDLNGIIQGIENAHNEMSR